jgi:hypothetical protein
MLLLLLLLLLFCRLNYESTRGTDSIKEKDTNNDCKGREKCDDSSIFDSQFREVNHKVALVVTVYPLFSTKLVGVRRTCFSIG